MSTDLESILLATPTLQELYLLGGLEIGNESEAVPTEKHTARLTTVVIMNGNYDHIGSDLLCWIVRA